MADYVCYLLAFRIIADNLSDAEEVCEAIKLLVEKYATTEENIATLRRLATALDGTGCPIKKVRANAIFNFLVEKEK